MEHKDVSPQVRYVANDQGQCTTVVLQWEDIQSLQAMISSGHDLLIGLSEPELRFLAQGVLPSGYQKRLSDLIERNCGGGLSEDEAEELERLLTHVDSMNILKARARRTLQLFEQIEQD